MSGFHDQWFLLPKVLYGLVETSAYAFYTFRGNFFEKSFKMNAEEIGHLFAFLSATTFIGPFLWSYISDRTKAHGKVLVFLLLASTTTFQLFHFRSRWLAYPVGALFTLFASGIDPILDTTTMKLLGDKPQLFGQQKMFASLSLSAVSFFIGMFKQPDFFHITWFILGFGLMGMLIVITLYPFGLFKIENKSVDVSSQGKKKRLNAIPQLILLFGNPSFSFFLFLIFVYGFTRNGMSMFYSIYSVNDLNVDTWIVGLSMFSVVFGEASMMFSSYWIIPRLGSRGCVVVASVLMSIRVWIFTCLSKEMPHSLLLGIFLLVDFLRGLSSGLFLCSASQIAQECAPDNLITTAQGAVSAVYSGLSAIVAASISGVVYKKFGPVLLFRGIAIVSVFCCFLSIFYYFLHQKINKVQEKAASGFISVSPEVELEKVGIKINKI